MSESYDKMKALIANISDEETKKSMNALLGELNQEKGKALSDLTSIKTKAQSLENDVKTMAELTKVLKEKGFEPKSPTDLIEIAKKFGVPTPDTATEDAYKQMIADLNDGKTKAEQELNQFKIKEAILPKLQKAMADYKDKDGKPVKIIEHFVDKNVLFKDIDINNEVLVNAKIKNVLEESLNKQAKFISETGFQIPGSTVHNVNLPGQGIKTGDGIIPTADAHKFFKDNGSDVIAAAKLFAMHDNISKT